MPTARKEQPVVEAVARACDLLKAFHSQKESLRLRDLVVRTGLNKATAFRILQTLEKQGFIERCGPREYRSRFRLLGRGRYRIGFAALSSASMFSQEVTEGISAAAARSDIDLLVLDNRDSPAVTLRNVELFIREQVDFVVEFQTNDSIAPAIASMFHKANLPFIALGTPHPGATFYGADSFKAGVCGGRFLGTWAKERMVGPVEEIVLASHSRIGLLPRSRVHGVQEGIYEVLPQAKAARVVYLDGGGRFEPTWEAMRKHLRTAPPSTRLIGAINDSSVLGALRALEEAGQLQSCAAVGQDALPAARIELRRPHSRLVATVAFFPERFGEEIIRLALNILAGTQMPPVVFIKHRLITAENVDQFYPNDGLLNREEIEHRLLRS